MSSEGKSGDANGARKKRLLRARFHYGAYIAIAVLSVLIDPFNWQESTTTVSRDLVSRLVTGPFYTTDYRDLTTVVLFRETTLHELRNENGNEPIHWPVSLKWHAEALNNILINEPSAVMVDFIFPDARPDEEGVQELIKVIRLYKEKGVHLFFGRADGAHINGIRPDLLKHVNLTSITRPDEAGITHGISRRYEPCKKMVVRDSSDFRFGQRVCACWTDAYELEACGANSNHSNSSAQVALTAAFQLFDAVNKQRPKLVDPNAPVDLHLVWSNIPNEWNDQNMRQNVDGKLELLCKDIETDPWSLLLAGFDTDRFKQGCPYTNTIFAESVLLDEFHPDNLRFLKDKVVFYGADLAGLADKVVPPTHVKLPGVYLHAMAFDNLSTSNGNYRYSLSDLVGNAWELGFNALVAGLVAFTAVFFARSRPSRDREKQSIRTDAGSDDVKEYHHRVNGWYCFTAVMLLVIWSLCILVYFNSRLTPLDWFGFSLLFLFVAGFVKGRFLERTTLFTKGRILPWLRSQILTEERR